MVSAQGWRLKVAKPSSGGDEPRDVSDYPLSGFKALSKAGTSLRPECSGPNLSAWELQRIRLDQHQVLDQLMFGESLPCHGE